MTPEQREAVRRKIALARREWMVWEQTRFGKTLPMALHNFFPYDWLGRWVKKVHQPFKMEAINLALEENYGEAVVRQLNDRALIADLFEPQSMSSM